MRRPILHRLLDSPSAWGLRILCVISFGITCALALTGSKRVVWLVFTSLALLLLYGINHMRIQRRLKHAPGNAIRPKRKAATHGDSTH